MKSWVRLWMDMPTDPKWRVVAKRSGRPLSEVLATFVIMLTSANDTGVLDAWSHEDAAAAIDTEPEHVEAIYTAMQGKVLDGTQLTGWERRQPKREDDSAARVRAFRERSKRTETPCNADVTQSNAPDSDPDSETEKTSLPPEQESAREEVKAILKDIGLGKGGVVSLDARRKVAAKLNITSADPIVAIFERWQTSHTARDIDAMFIGSAARIFRNAEPEVKAACQPLHANPDPPKPIPRPSRELSARLRETSYGTTNKQSA